MRWCGTFPPSKPQLYGWCGPLIATVRSERLLRLSRDFARSVIARFLRRRRLCRVRKALATWRCGVLSVGAAAADDSRAASSQATPSPTIPLTFSVPPRRFFS